MIMTIIISGNIRKRSNDVEYIIYVMEILVANHLLNPVVRIKRKNVNFYRNQ